MKNYSIFTAILSVTEPIKPGQIIPFIVTLPNNAIPVNIQYSIDPTGTMPVCALYYLVPCDEGGNLIEEVISSNVYEMAWNELFKLFGERSEQDNLDVMDAVLKGVILELQSDEEAREETIQEELSVNHKGRQCWVNKELLCQEGWCSGCQIYLDWLKEEHV